MNHLFVLFIFFFSQSVFSKIILIDPGHGGYEVGAQNSIKIKNKKITIYEKDMTLALALKIQQKLKNKYQVYLTRKKDEFVSLEKRAMIAQRVKADIVISIHFNSEKTHTAHGLETYYIDNHNNEVVHKLETIENAGYSTNDSMVNKILIDLAVKLTSKQSKQLASSIHKSIIKKVSKKYKIRDRKYRPGNFFVLALAKRPGILLEAGFLSNEKELKKIMSSEYLEDLTRGLDNGLSEYYKKSGK